MQQFMLGMISMGSLVAALFFLRYWRITGDRLFIMFALAFALEAVNRALFAYSGASREEATLYFVTRLAAFMLILIAVIDKNMRRR